MRRHSLQHGPPRKPPHPDLARVQSILAGSTVEWQTLVEEFAGLATAMVMRQLRDEDTARDVVVDVFGRLYDGQLRSYNGSASFRTWFLVVVRRAVLDHLRSQKGRDRLPAAIARRPRMEQRAFELFFLLGWPSHVVLAQMQSQGWSLDRDQFWSLVEAMDASLAPRVRRRLRYERSARREGVASGRWLEYVEDQQHQGEAAQIDQFEETAHRSADAVHRINAELSRLPSDERHALALRYSRELTAREIAEEMQLAGPRQAFSLLDRATRRLRKALELPLDSGLRLRRDP